MERFAYFGGVDFSGAKEPLCNLWAAVGVEREGKLHVMDLRPLPYREDLAHHVTGGWREVVGIPGDRFNGSVLWGVDFPMGLPRAALEVILDDAGGKYVGWYGFNQWLAERSPVEVKARLRPFTKVTRETDALSGAMAPLDLRLCAQTVVGARWIYELSRDFAVGVRPQSPADLADLTVIEVYPSATRSDLGIKPGRAPRRAGEVRARPAALSEWVTFDHPAMEATAVTLEDAWDAVLACVTAWLVKDDLDQPARCGARSAGIEGWIYRHPKACGM